MVFFLETKSISTETADEWFASFVGTINGYKGYIKKVFIPSAIYNVFSRSGGSLYYNYHNMPWEYGADYRGRAEYEHAPWAGAVATAYFATVGGFR